MTDEYPYDDMFSLQPLVDRVTVEKKVFDVLQINNLNFFGGDQKMTLLCTGLRDKNGKWIFEGDIVRYDVDSERTGRIATVEFRQAHFALIRDGKDDYDVWKALNIEVIGNIHQNQE